MKSMVYTINGSTGTLPVLCKLFGVSEHCVRFRMRNGMTLQEALTTPTQMGGKRVPKPKEPEKVIETPKPEEKKHEFVRVGASGGYWR